MIGTTAPSLSLGFAIMQAVLLTTHMHAGLASVCSAGTACTRGRTDLVSLVSVSTNEKNYHNYFLLHSIAETCTPNYGLVAHALWRQKLFFLCLILISFV